MHVDKEKIVNISSGVALDDNIQYHHPELLQN